VLVLVDGYNVTMNDPALRDRSKEAQRDGLIERVRVLAPSIARGGSIVIVFDAHGSVIATSEKRGAVKVLYADSADDAIVRRCSGQAGNVVVYTGDLRLRARISQDVGRHVEYRDVSSLFVGTPATRSRKRPAAVREDGPPPNAKDITAELSELWLDDEKE